MAFVRVKEVEMPVIRFNYPDEYIEELKKESLEKPIVRLTNLQRPIEKVAPLRSLSVVSTAKAATGDIIRLEHYCGQLWGLGKEDKRIWERAEAIHEEIKKACQDLDLEVRAGIYETI